MWFLLFVFAFHLSMSAKRRLFWVIGVIKSQLTVCLTPTYAPVNASSWSKVFASPWSTACSAEALILTKTGGGNAFADWKRLGTLYLSNSIMCPFRSEKGALIAHLKVQPLPLRWKLHRKALISDNFPPPTNSEIITNSVKSYRVPGWFSVLFDSWFQLRSWFQGCEMEPRVGLGTGRGPCLRFSPSLSLCSFPLALKNVRKGSLMKNDSAEGVEATNLR